MNEQIKQIALRLSGLRDALDLSVEEMAKQTGVQAEDIRLYESGTSDIPMSFLCNMAKSCGVETSTLVSGTEPHSQSFYLTRKGKGPTVERVKAYKYNDLASGFRNAKSTPFEVTVAPNNNSLHLNSHSGQEFNLVLEGTLMLQIAGTDLVLTEGDSIYFDATKPHGMKALNNQNARFLAIII